MEIEGHGQRQAKLHYRGDHREFGCGKASAEQEKNYSRRLSAVSGEADAAENHAQVNSKLRNWRWQRPVPRKRVEVAQRL
jgi:hypothetical protein